jgi:ribosomal protein S14
MNSEVTQERTCAVCGGPLASYNRLGICHTSPECSAARQRADKAVRAGIPVPEAVAAAVAGRPPCLVCGRPLPAWNLTTYVCRQSGRCRRVHHALVQLLLALAGEA